MKALKKVLSAIAAVVVVVLIKMKAAAIYSAKVLVVMLLHMALGKDSTTATANKRNAGKPPHVAQVPQTKNNPAEKLTGPMAPAQSKAPAVTPAAPLGAGPIQAARNAAAAQNAQLSKETGQAVPTAAGAPPGGQQQPAPAPTKAPANQSAPVVQQGAPTNPAKAGAAAAASAVASTSATNSVESSVMREAFDYSRESRRDPFVSLMTTSDLRPTLSDLRLTGILYDLSGRRPVAILRDVAGGQWRVTTGMTLGRMRVAQIRPKAIIFTIEEFGFNRQDSLLLGDTTRVRRR